MCDPSRQGRFWSLVAIVAVALCLLAYPAPATPVGQAFRLVATVVQVPILLMPGMLLTWAIWRCRATRRCTAAVAILLAAVTGTGLLIDARIVSLYGFHMNGFVWNLVATAGGLQSMGATRATCLSVAAGIVVALLVAALVWRLSWPGGRVQGRRSAYVALPLLAIWGVLLLGEKSVYAYAVSSRNQQILDAAGSVPLYIGVTARSLLARYVQPVEHAALNMPARQTFNYPCEPLRVVPPARKPHVVWLTAESLRADALQAEIMPHATAFAAHAWRFTHHYSGGNGTRMGMFSMFYGIPGSYWFSAVRGHTPPVLLRVLRGAGYDMKAYTSTNFTYPEFDATIFADFSSDEMISDSVG